MRVKGNTLFLDVHLSGGKKRERFKGFCCSRGSKEFVDAITIYRFNSDGKKDTPVGRIEIQKGKLCVFTLVSSKRKIK